MDIILNACAVVASILGLALPLQLLRFGQPRSTEEKRRLFWRYCACWAVGTVLLGFFGFQFAHRIKTTTQSGDFANYTGGVKEIFYAIPYKGRPHLRVDLKSRFSIGGSAEIIEQRPDGFKVRLGSAGSEYWIWIAEGIAHNPDKE